MKKTHLVQILFFVQIFVSVATFAKPFSIGIIGDQTQSEDLAQSYAILEKGVEILNRAKVNLILHVGDIIESKKNEKEVASDFAAATSILRDLDAPWYLTPGNHDVNPPFGTTGDDALLPRKTYYNLYRSANPQLNEALYYSFNVNQYHFIALNSAENFHRDPRWGNILFAKLGYEQFNWLVRDLENNRRAKGIIVFTHMPLWYNVTDWLKVHELLSKYPVKAVIAGHFHYNQRDQLIDGIQYVVVGATGGTIKQASSNAGGMHHVTVLQIEGKNLDFTLYPIEGALPDEVLPPTMPLTPRTAMDRVQMVDQMLSAQEGYKYYDSGLRLHDLKNLPSCNSPDDWMFAVPFIGNPVDSEIELEFNLDFGTLDHIHSWDFRKDTCRTINGWNDPRCTLAPDAMISIANPYVVEGNDFAGFNDALFFGEVWPKEKTWSDENPRSLTKENGIKDIRLTVRTKLKAAKYQTEEFILKSHPFYLFEPCPNSAEK